MFVLLSSSSVLTYGQNMLDSIQFLDEIVVTAQPFKKIIPAQKLSGPELQHLSVHSVADALRYFSGTQLKDYGGVGGVKTIDVRNMGSHHVGVFYDGVEVGNAQNGVVDLGKFSLDDMEELSLYNGQKSDIFQSAKDFSSASSIYLQTKRPIFKDDKRYNMLFRYKAMTMDFINPSMRLEYKISDKVKMSASGEMIKTNGRYKFNYRRKNMDGTMAYDTTAIRKNSDVESYRFETALFGVIEDGSWSAKAYYYDSNRGAPGAIVANKFSNGFRQSDKDLFVQGDVKKDFTPNYHFQLKGKYDYNRMHYLARDTMNFENEVTTEGAQFDDTYYQQEVYLSMVNMYNVTNWWDVSVAIDYQWNKLNGRRRGVQVPFAYPTRHTLLASVASSFDFGPFKAMVSGVGTYVKDRVEHGVARTPSYEFTPALFLSYQPFESQDFTIRAFAKRVLRMPTFNDLYYTGMGASLLKPEYMNQINLGFNYEIPFDNHPFFNRISLKTDAYYTKTKNKIIAVPTGNLFRWMMTNIGRVKGHGIESTIKLGSHIGKVALSTDVAYAYSVSRDYTKLNGLQLSSYGDQIPYTPWHSGSVVQNVNYDGWNLNYSFIYVGKRYNHGFNNIPANKVQPWYTHDVSLSKVVNLKHVVATGAVEVSNLFNQQYEVIANYPMPGRMFRFIVTLEI